MPPKLDEYCKTGKVIDESLCQTSMDKVCEQVAELFDKKPAFGHKISSQFVSKGKEQDEIQRLKKIKFGMKFYQKHVRMSQLLFQVAKCNDLDCEFCDGTWKSNFQEIVGGRFVPVPILMTYGENGFTYGRPEFKQKLKPNQWFGNFSQNKMLNELNMFKNNQLFGYDFFNGAVSTELLKERTCEDCGYYLMTKGMYEEHLKVCNLNKYRSLMKKRREEAKRRKKERELRKQQQIGD